MLYKVTSAEASKLLRKLNEEKEMYLSEEKQSCIFNAALGEDIESVRPAYDYKKTQAQLELVNEKIRIVKHAINCFNVKQVVGDTGMTIDQVLIKIPQLSELRSKLYNMQDRLPKVRYAVSSTSNIIDYRYANYSIDEAKADYMKVSDDLRALQTALDIVNTTITMEFELPD